MKTTIHLDPNPDTLSGFTIATTLQGEHAMDFKVFEVLALNGETRVYGELNDEQTDPLNAPPFATGHLKWDGCGNFDLHETHICGRRRSARIGALMTRIYDIGALVIPAWDEHTAG